MAPDLDTLMKLKRKPLKINGDWNKYIDES